MEVVETEVEIETPDGTCDAAFVHPGAGAHAGVLIWPDAFGLRPAMREMARGLAVAGYSVLVPNPFYRVAKGAVADPSHFDFRNPADFAKLQPLMASVNAPGNAEKDAVAYVAFLDALHSPGTDGVGLHEAHVGDQRVVLKELEQRPPRLPDSFRPAAASGEERPRRCAHDLLHADLVDGHEGLLLV